MEQPKSSLKSVETYIIAAVTVLGAVLTVMPADTWIAKVIGAVLALAGSLGFLTARTSAKNTAALVSAPTAPPAP